MVDTDNWLEYSSNTNLAHIIVNSCPQQNDGPWWILIRKLNSHIIFEPLNAFWLVKIYLDISEIVLKSMHTATLSAARPRLDIIESYAALLEWWNLFWHIRNILVKELFSLSSNFLFKSKQRTSNLNKVADDAALQFVVFSLHDFIPGMYHLESSWAIYFIRFVG